jgi:hypothetical protein
MKMNNKKANFLHRESRIYRGLRSVRKNKILANRIERRSMKQVDLVDEECLNELQDILLKINDEE